MVVDNAEGKGEIARPPGVKLAKAAALSAAEDMRVRKHIANATAALARSSAKRVKVIEDANRLALFATKLDELDPDAQEFFRAKRASVLDELRAESCVSGDAAHVVDVDRDTNQ